MLGPIICRTKNPSNRVVGLSTGHIGSLIHSFAIAHINIDMYLHFDINQIEVETMHVVFDDISARQKIMEMI